MSTQHADTSLDITIGTTVVCRDGSKGRVTRLAMEPNSKHVTHLIVQYGLPHHEVVVPIEQVAQVQDDTLVLTLDRDELSRLPRFAEVDYTLPDEAWLDHFGRSPGDIVFSLRGYTPSGVLLDAAWAGHFVSGHAHRGMATEEVPVGRGTRITCRDGQLGRVDHVLLDPKTNIVQAVVARRGHLLGKDVVIPVAQVEWIAEDEIHIDADRATLEDLPEYHPVRTDEQITAEVLARLATQEQTRDEPTIAAEMRDGVVHLSGVVRTEEAKRAAAIAAGAVAGVWEVENGLLVGRDLAQIVDDALAHDARTAQAVIESTYSDGSLTLRGQVRYAREKEAAVAIAGNVRGVAAVIDELEIEADANRRSGSAPSLNSMLDSGSRLGMLKRP
jgi:osmotically-inducible protein OsmY/sporulation protein YlmC with PRC-barrel domain